MAALCRLRPIISKNIHPASLICKRNKKSPRPQETLGKGEYDIPPKKGRPTDKKPFPMELQAGKKYAWCTCGESHEQPFCDGSHKKMKGKGGSLEIKFSPHRFEVTETKQYWLCMCKQTDNRPFCDGHHLDETIQKKFR